MMLGTEPLFVGLGLDKHTAYGEIVFIDPCADLAVINCPSGFYESVPGYDELLNSRTNLDLAVQEGTNGFEVSIPGNYGSCLHGRATLCGSYGIRVVFDADTDRALAGMSGSPILNAQGQVVGLLKSGSVDQPNADGSLLAECLPGWLYREVLG